MDLPAVGVGATCGLLAGPVLAIWAARWTADPRPAASLERQGVSLNRVILVSAAAVVAGAGMGAAWGFSVALPAYLGFAFVSVALADVDLRCRRLPDLLVAVLAGWGLASLVVAGVVLDDLGRMGGGVMAGLVASGVFLVLALLWPAHLGFGDVKLAGALGLYLGWVGWLALAWGLAAGFLLAAIVATVLVVAKRAGLRDPLPLGPFLALGAWVVLLVSAPM